MLNLRSIDLNLLPVFEAAYEESSLSGAARRLSLTQPAVSHALARLRATFRDELFVRHSRGVRPTPAADALYASVREALALVRGAVEESRGFDPATSRRRFSVSIPHPLGPLLAVRLMDRVAAAAPGVALSFSTRSRPVDQDDGLVAGRFDLALDWVPPAAASLAAETAFHDGVRAMVRRGHPALAAGRRGGKARDWPVVRLRPRTDWAASGLAGVRDWLDSGLTVGLEVSEMLEVLAVAARSELVGIVPASLEPLARREFGLEVLEGLPASLRIPVRLVYRESRRAEAALGFLRREMRAAIEDFVTDAKLPKGAARGTMSASHAAAPRRRKSP